jgi:hypothetical protein
MGAEVGYGRAIICETPAGMKAAASPVFFQGAIRKPCAVTRRFPRNCGNSPVSADAIRAAHRTEAGSCGYRHEELKTRMRAYDVTPMMFLDLLS